MSPSLILSSSSEKSSSSCTFFGFPASSAYLNPFHHWLYDFEIHLLTLRTIEGLMHNYYKRWKHVLMLKKATQCIKRPGGGGGGVMKLDDQGKLYLLCLLEKRYLSYKNASIRYRRPLFTPSRVMCILIWMHTLYLTTFALLNTTTRPCYYRAWKSKDNFEYNSDWIHRKEESHIHLGCLEGE